MITFSFKYKLFLVIILALGQVYLLQGQNNITNPYYSNIQKKWFSTKNKNIQLDTFSIIPSSIKIKNFDNDCYNLDIHQSIIKLSESCNWPDSVLIEFRNFPYSFSRSKSLDKFSFDSMHVFGIYTNNAQEDNNELKFNELDYMGAYSRSMNLGNSQSLSLNSNFNFQINGYLLDSIRIEGAITDNQIPFQPDGNTQRIQEFDRLYLIFEKGKHKITLGDYNLDKPNSYFLNFNKRVQGAYYQFQNWEKGKIKNTLGFSGSIAKGQFARNIFEGTEGNQGPYKLTGNNGEQFFILLAGTEKVYIDGILLQRGEDRDYIINYNTGEISFMPRILITKDKRIQVEFEYQDRNYLNSLFYAYDHLEINEKLSFNINVYSNQDAKNQPYLQEINDPQRRFLYELGDNINEAYYPSATQEPFAANKILYRQFDTTDINTGITYHNIYEYSIDSTLAQYALSFSYVGESKGNYMISSENTNGRSYQWIPPKDGIPQGAYEPVIMLVTPKLHQVFTLGTQYKIDSLKTLSIETSLSNYDPNMYAPNKGLNHTGLATKISYQEKRLFGKSDSLNNKKYSIDNQILYEYVQSNYKVIAPYRNIEFFRDWNIIQEDSVQADEHLFQFQTKIEKQGTGNIHYDFSLFKRDTIYTALRNIVGLQYNRNNYRTGLIFNLMNSSSIHKKSSFFRPSIYLEKTFPNWQNLIIGGRYDQEHNEITTNYSDAIISGAYSFDIYNLYLKAGSSEDFTYGINYRLRKDRDVRDSIFVDKNEGHNVDVVASMTKWENHQLDFTGGFRSLIVHDSNFTINESAGKTLIGRINYTGNIKNGFFTPNILYEFGSGQEQKRSYTYVEVPQGQGQYYWVDYNEDGIQQANEFEVGLYPDQKRFIRMITPNNEYVKVNFYKLNVAFSINFSSLYEEKDATKFQNFLRKISNQFSMESSNRILSEAGLGAYVPFQNNFTDTQIIAHNNNIINSFFFNRADPKWGLEWITNYIGMKALLTYGLESSQWLRQTGQLRYNINKNYSTQLKFKNGFRSYYSGIEDGRTYHYNHLGGSSSFTFIYQSRWRLTATYDYERRENLPHLGGELAKIHAAQLDSRFSFENWGNIQIGGTLSMIDFNGIETNGVGFAMLDALKIGNNFLWNLQWNTKISKNIELSIQYDGRKPAKTPTIHTASMSLRALL